jgi:hypothetical protein
MSSSRASSRSSALRPAGGVEVRVEVRVGLGVPPSAAANRGASAATARAATVAPSTCSRARPWSALGGYGSGAPRSALPIGREPREHVEVVDDVEVLHDVEILEQLEVFGHVEGADPWV